MSTRVIIATELSFLLGVLSGQNKKFVFFQKGNKDKLTPIFTFCIYLCKVINFFMFILFFYDEIMVPNNINIVFYLIIM